MRLFLDPPERAEPGVAGPVVGNQYAELEWRTRPNLPSLVLHCVPMFGATATLCACCGNAFDATIEALRSAAGDALSTVLVDYWDILARLIADGQMGDLSFGGLVRIVDSDDGVKKSFVATTVPITASGGVIALNDVQVAAARVFKASVACVRQGIEAFVAQPEVRELLAPPNDIHHLYRRTEAVSQLIPLWDLDRVLGAPLLRF